MHAPTIGKRRRSGTVQAAAVKPLAAPSAPPPQPLKKR